jgi:hypothetical protein
MVQCDVGIVANRDADFEHDRRAEEACRGTATTTNEERAQKTERLIFRDAVAYAPHCFDKVGIFA